MQVEYDDAMLRWIGEQEDRRWTLFLDYWRDLFARHGRLPRRAEIDPVSLPNLLPNLFLVDVVRGEDPDPRFRFRLLGGAITHRESIRPGQYLDDFEAMHGSEAIMRHYNDALLGKVRIRDATLAWDHPTKHFMAYHVMLLPLAEDGESVDTLLGLALYEA